MGTHSNLKFHRLTTFHLRASLSLPIRSLKDCLPVEELIQRVARRWTAPTASQLRLRLMIGCAMHRACRDLIRATDTKSCFVLTQWFCEAYNVLLQHHLVARDPDSITRLIGRHYVEQPERADALRWLYSLEQWQQLPRRMFDQLG